VRAVLKLEETVPMEVLGGLASPCPSHTRTIERPWTRKTRTPTSIRVPIAWKFFAVLALVIPSLLAVSWVGGRGMVEMKELDAVYEDNLASARAIGSLSVALEEAEQLSLRLYRAKANSRNRVEMFTLDDATEGESSPGTNAATPAAS
jgi:nitrate reductase NapE component